MINDAHLHHLQGRIIALELVARAYLTGEALQGNDPITHVRSMRRSFFGSLQHVERSTDEASEQIWEEATQALTELFDQTERRVTGIATKR